MENDKQSNGETENKERKERKREIKEEREIGEKEKGKKWGRERETEIRQTG